MRIKILFAALLGGIMLFTACEESEQNQGAQITLGFEAVQTGDMLKASDTLVFDSAMVGISEIEIEGEQEAENDGDAEDMEYEYEGSYPLDLLAGTSLSDIVAIEPGIYTELEAEIESVLDDGHSIYIEARYINSEDDTSQVVYYTDESVDFEVENEEGIQINDQDIKELLIRIDLQGLFSSIDLDAAMHESDTIFINEDYNESMAEQLEGYLDDHSEFEEDDDDDDDNDGDDDDDEEDDDDDDSDD